MTSTPRTASTSDARKRQAEKDGASEREPLGEFYFDELLDTADHPPVLPDTSGWVKREPGDVIEAGTPYVVRMGGKFITTGVSDGSDGVGTAVEVLTPPPAPREPWRAISTDRDKPTLAKVMWVGGGIQTANVYVEADKVYNEWDEVIGRTDLVTHVEVRHTHDPVTQVPVERALIDEAVQIADEPDFDVARAHRLIDEISDLAALTDGAES